MVGIGAWIRRRRLPRRTRARRGSRGGRGVRGFGVEGVDGGAMLRVLGALTRALPAFVGEERLVRLSRTGRVPFFRETLCAKHQAVEVRGDRRENGVGFGERAVRIVSGEVQYAQVVVGVEIER